MKDEAGLAQLFDEWRMTLDSDSWNITNKYLLELMKIKNMGETSAKGLLAKVYVFVKEKLWE